MSSPFRRSTCSRRNVRARLACFSHAASVQSEPGSNSSICFVIGASTVKIRRFAWRTPTRLIGLTVGLHRIQVRHAQGMICEFDVGRLAISCRCIYGHPATLHRNGEAPRFLGINLNWSSQGCPTDDMLCRRPVGYVLLLRVSEAVGRHILAACPNHSLGKEESAAEAAPSKAFRNRETRHDTGIKLNVNPYEGGFGCSCENYRCENAMFRIITPI